MNNQKIIDAIEKIKKMLEKHSKIVLSIMFILGIIIYGHLVSKVNNISFLGVDEELYINMARSFFYDGNFAKGYEILNYNCVLYSMLISIAYFFYSPENILFFMRLIGVILMVSSVFPIYLLSKKVLNSKIKALGIAALGLLILEMGLSAYIIQEVLIYPIFLWTLYLIYIKFTSKNFASYKIDFVITLLLVIMFFIKSYGIAFGIAYFLSLLIIDGKKNLKNIILNGILFILIIIVGYLLIYAINDFQVGTNHYSFQMKRIFPITINTFKNFAYGILYYSIFTLFCTGIIPIVIPLLNIRKYEENDKKLIIFLLISIVMIIIETAIIVFIPEESNKIYPNKYCYRYYFVVTIPLIIMFLKLKNQEIKISKSVVIIYIITFAYLLWYYIGQGTMLTSIDAPILFCIQNLFQLDMGMILIMVFILIYTCMIISSLKETKKIKSIYIEAMIAVSLAFSFQYWNYIFDVSNNLYGGKNIQSDFKIISENIRQDYDKVYLVDGEELEYKKVRTIGAELNTGYRIIKLGEVANIENKKICVVIPKKCHLQVIGAKKIKLDTNRIELYVSDNEYTRLQIVEDIE